MDLQHVIRRRRPFSSPALEAHLNLARTHGMLAADVAAVLKPEGLGEASYNVLRILAGVHREPVDGRSTLTCGEIGARMVTRVPDVTRLLDRLQKQGLVERVRDEHDRRVVQAGITAEGLRVADRLRIPLERLHDKAFAPLDEQELETLNRLLTRVRAPHEEAASVSPSGRS